MRPTQAPKRETVTRTAEPSTPRVDGVTLWVDGRPLRCRKGEPVASALIADDIRYLRDSPTGGTPRGAFCMMGACQECVADVDGTLRQTCLVPVRDGMRVTLAKRS